jgi:hypothetical protein
MSTALLGKGFYIWQIRNCEGGRAEAIAAKAQAANLSHVMLKIADTTFAFGFDRNNLDITAPVANALRQRGIQVWGWHYVKGDDPEGEARIAVQRTKQLKLDGYVVDAEVEYKAAGKAEAARTFMTSLRNGLGPLPVALSSYRFPSFHKDFPWAAFLEQCDLNMPQVYWEQAHNADVQLQRSVIENNNSALVGYVRPIVPTGSAYGTGGWRAEPDDLRRFFAKARELKLWAANAYSWDWATSTGNTDLWDAVAGVDWPFENQVPPAIDIVDRFITALNNRDLDGIFELYQPNAAHVTAKRTIVGNNAISNYYYDVLFNQLPNATFTVRSQTGQDPTRIFSWSALSPRGRVLDGQDTLGLRDGLIQYHYTRFSIGN